MIDDARPTGDNAPAPALRPETGDSDFCRREWREWIMLNVERVVRLLTLALAVLAVFPDAGSVFAVRTLGSNAFSPGPAAASWQEAPTALAWNEYFGYWRLDPGIAIGPEEPFRLRISVDGDELHIERYGFSLTEISRYRLRRRAVDDRSEWRGRRGGRRGRAKGTGHQDSHAASRRTRFERDRSLFSPAAVRYASND